MGLLRVEENAAPSKNESRSGEKSVVLQLDPTLCVGCGACVNICPCSALVFATDAHGFYRPRLVPEKCNECGLCARTCPVLHLPENKNLLAAECYAIIARDDGLLRASSSGGAFSLLARQTLAKGGAVAGAVWTDDFSVVHILSDSAADLSRMRKSKYVQSLTGEIFTAIEKRLSQGQLCLFSGCPCQVAGLRAYLGRDYENLILVDLLCSYAPSPLFFKKYIKDEFGNDILRYEFRHKLPGRKNDCSVVAIATSSGEVARIGRAEDSWQRLIHDYVMCPPHCENCSFCGLPRFGDFSLGDFWGIEAKDKGIDAGKGVSALLCNNQKASQYLATIPAQEFSLRKRVDLAWLGVNGNVLPGKNRTAPPSRAVFFECITFMPFSQAAGYALNAGHAHYNYLWHSTNTLLQYSSEFLRWRYDPLYWEEHFINGMAMLLVKPGQWQLGRFARLPLARPLLRNRKYTVNIQFCLKTAKDYINFHFSSSNTDGKHVFYTMPLKPEDRTGLKIHKVKLAFEPGSDCYDEFMIAASQITGFGNFIGFQYISVEEDHT